MRPQLAIAVEKAEALAVRGGERVIIIRANGWARWKTPARGVRPVDFLMLTKSGCSRRVQPLLVFAKKEGAGVGGAVAIREFVIYHQEVILPVIMEQAQIRAGRRFVPFIHVFSLQSLWVTQPPATTGSNNSSHSLCRMTGDCGEAAPLQAKYPSDSIPQILARVNNFPGNRARGHGHRRREKHLVSLSPMRPGKFRFVALMHLMPGLLMRPNVSTGPPRHAAQPAFSVICTPASTRMSQIVLPPQRVRLQIVHNVRRRRHAERVNRHALAAQHARELHEIARLAARAGADVGAVEFGVAHVLRLFALARIGMARDRRFELAQIHDEFINELLVLVRLDRL